MNTTITLNIPKAKPETLYEASKKYGGLDIADRDWDMGIFFECPESWDEASDNYDKFMLLLGCNIRVEHCNPDWYTTCYISDFLWNNKDVFDKFFNKYNIEGYRPMDYDKLDPEEDTGFYEAYMQPIESLIAGNYTDACYEELFNMLSAKAV